MEILDTKTLVHVGVELVVVGGLAFWFQRKTSLQQQEINNLRDELSKVKEVLNSQGKMLAQYDQILGQLMGRRGPQEFSGENHRSSNLASPQNHPRSNQSHQHINVNQSPVDEDDEDDMLDDELDDLLKEELGNIHKSREQPQDSEILELECNGGTCNLKNLKRGTKSNNRESVKKKDQRKKKKEKEK